MGVFVNDVMRFEGRFQKIYQTYKAEDVEDTKILKIEKNRHIFSKAPKIFPKKVFKTVFLEDWGA